MISNSKDQTFGLAFKQRGIYYLIKSNYGFG